MKLKSCLLLFVLLCSVNAYASEKTVIRLATLAFGTVNWELEALKNEGLLETADFELKIQAVANPQAGKVALQSGAVDMIVSDWIWVSRMRSSGSDFSFYPYSNTSGALIVPADSFIQSLKDLQGKKLGIAGGELDKNWLLLQALAKKQGIDLASTITPIYGAPPLLNQQLLQGNIDAVLNYWHFAARLKAQGYRELFDGKSILTNLSIPEAVPSLGYVFNQTWATEHQQAINSFLNATQQAKKLLCENGKVWQKIILLTKAKDEATQKALRESYCAGLIKDWGDKQQQAAESIYQLLRAVSNNKLTGNTKSISAGTFWNKDY